MTALNTALPILLAGCTTHGLSKVYLLSLSYADTGAATTQNNNHVSPNTIDAFMNLTENVSGLEVRASYFGFCLTFNSSASTCSNSIDNLASTVQQRADGQDPLNLLWTAKQFRDATIFSGLM
ncbi:unnamed protein product [Parascedosporium putredinis]|uniref:Uncharacterized protein n=1 Tax=Parascedosporium putredinis TaxID=1442378 RepID=A0A9P1HC49_9PEZI|nr:unnamed protein product [Parascedosporium putredinis]CAI8004343.1 unnamed protein product [Parascedosporium putredinis]